MGKKALDVIGFSERLSGGRRVEVMGFKGIEKGIFFKRFLSMPYSIPTNQMLSRRVLKELKRRFLFFEVSLLNPPETYTFKLLSPAVFKGRVRYHRERRRLIRRAESSITDIKWKVSDIRKTLKLINLNAKKHGKKNVKNLEKVITMDGVDVIEVYVGEIVGVIVNLMLEDRYLLWQMGWKGYNFLPTYLLHLSIQRGFSLGYDTVDMGITRSERAIKVKYELGCDMNRFVYIIQHNPILQIFGKP